MTSPARPPGAAFLFTVQCISTGVMVVEQAVLRFATPSSSSYEVVIKAFDAVWLLVLPAELAALLIFAFGLPQGRRTWAVVATVFSALLASDLVLQSAKVFDPLAEPATQAHDFITAALAVSYAVALWLGVSEASTQKHPGLSAGYFIVCGVVTMLGLAMHVLWQQKQLADRLFLIEADSWVRFALMLGRDGMLLWLLSGVAYGGSAAAAGQPGLSEQT